METTRLSTKGQIILPKKVRESRAWLPGMEFVIEEAGDGILLRPAARFPETRLEDVAGCLRTPGRSKSHRQTAAAIGREVMRRHDRGRY
jgi:AbrB family looped-hinge helix DNA binding protein